MTSTMKKCLNWFEPATRAIRGPSYNYRRLFWKKSSWIKTLCFSYIFSIIQLVSGSYLRPLSSAVINQGQTLAVQNTIPVALLPQVRSFQTSTVARDIDSAAKFIGAGAATVGVAGSGILIVKTNKCLMIRNIQTTFRISKALVFALWASSNLASGAAVRVF